MKALGFGVLGLCFVSGVVANLQAQLMSHEWTMFKSAFNKTYLKAKEDRWRSNIYLENRNKIMRNNENFRNKAVSFKMKINHLSDHLKSEVVDSFGYTGFGVANGRPYDGPKSNCTSVDWRTKGAVGKVLNQGFCGSCYAFSTAQVMYGQMMRKYNIQVEFSIQAIVDCSQKHGNHGCSGGLMTKAYTFIQDSGGLESESAYPYVGEECKCVRDSRNFRAKVIGHVNIEPCNEEALASAVQNYGPMAIGIDSSPPSFSLYGGGIYYEPSCSSVDLCHAVLLVGFGSDPNNNFTCGKTLWNGMDYWIVKNSWGTDWGEDGYMRLARGAANHCGVATLASYPEIELIGTTPTTTQPPTIRTTTEQPEEASATSSVYEDQLVYDYEEVKQQNFEKKRSKDKKHA